MPSNGELPCLLAKKLLFVAFQNFCSLRGFFLVAEMFLFNLGALKALGIIC